MLAKKKNTHRNQYRNIYSQRYNEPLQAVISQLHSSLRDAEHAQMLYHSIVSI